MLVRLQVRRHRPKLTSEIRSGYSGSYTYDANGNRATRTVGGITEDYAGDNADKLSTVKIANFTQKSYRYDTAGRTTSVVSGAGTTTLAHDYEGRLDHHVSVYCDGHLPL